MIKCDNSCAKSLFRRVGAWALLIIIKWCLPLPTVMADQFSRWSFMSLRLQSSGRSGSSLGPRTGTDNRSANRNGSKGAEEANFSLLRTRTETCSAQLLNPRRNIRQAFPNSPCQLAMGADDKLGKIRCRNLWKRLICPQVNRSFRHRFRGIFACLLGRYSQNLSGVYLEPSADFSES